MSDVTTLGTSVVADRPVKVCPGIEDRPCGKEIPAILTWCEDCSDERRKLKRRGYSSNAYQADPEPRKEKSRECYRQQQHRQECKVVIRTATWIKNEMDRERDLRFGFDRPLPPPLPKAYQRMRQPRRDRVFARANDLVIQEIRRAAQRMNKHGRTLKHFPYRPPRLQDILPPQPEPAETTISGGQYKTRLYRGKKRGRKKKRGRPPLTEAQKYERAWRRACSLFHRVEHEKMLPHEAWYAVNPQSGMSRENATRETRRLIAWLRREHPLTLGERLYLSGMSDLDGICREIKALLEANLPATGKLPERPNWYVRSKGLQLLMRGLGLATWRGFRSGPHAVGGELEDVPMERNDVPAGDEDSVADIKRRIKAQSIFFRNQFEGIPLADCWLELNPHSKANRITAKKEAADLADYFQKRYASSLSERLIANGLDELVVIAAIKELKEAERASDRQWKLLSTGLDMQMVILGYRPPSGRSVPRQALGPCGDMSSVDLESEEELPPLSPEEARRSCAAGIYWRHFVEGMALPDAWVELHPETKGRVTEEAAASAAEGELTWFRQTHPMPMVTLMETHDLGTDNLIRGIKELGEATKRLRVGTTWKRNEKGRVVSTTGHYIDVEDWRAHDAALGKQIVLHGYGPGGWRRPAQSADCQEPDEPEEPPKTYEEAVARGKPYTFIEHPPEISHEEWQRQWDKYQAERERIIAKYGEFSEKYLTWLRNQNQRQR